MGRCHFHKNFNTASTFCSGVITFSTERCAECCTSMQNTSCMCGPQLGVQTHPVKKYLHNLIKNHQTCEAGSRASM